MKKLLLLVLVASLAAGCPKRKDRSHRGSPPDTRPAATQWTPATATAPATRPVPPEPRVEWRTNPRLDVDLPMVPASVDSDRPVSCRVLLTVPTRPVPTSATAATRPAPLRIDLRATGRGHDLCLFKVAGHPEPTASASDLTRVLVARVKASSAKRPTVLVSMRGDVRWGHAVSAVAAAQLAGFENVRLAGRRARVDLSSGEADKTPAQGRLDVGVLSRRAARSGGATRPQMFWIAGTNFDWAGGANLADIEKHIRRLLSEAARQGHREVEVNLVADENLPWVYLLPIVSALQR